jgi:hypothetical protein
MIRSTPRPRRPRALARLAAAALTASALGACNLVIGVDDFEPAPHECASAADCLVPAAACLEAACVEGRCGEAPRSLGSACSVGAGTTCDGTGSCVKCLPQEKVPAELNTGRGCGGPSCTRCPDGERCEADGDCLGGRCVAKVCSTLG